MSNTQEKSQCCGAESLEYCEKCMEPFFPQEKEEWIQECPRCGGREWSIPEYICDKCHWQDPTVKKVDSTESWIQKNFKEESINWTERFDAEIVVPWGNDSKLGLQIKSFIKSEREKAQQEEREKSETLILGLQTTIEGMQKMLESFINLSNK